MRNLLFLAALAASTAAVAQTTPDPNAAGNMDQTTTQQPTDMDPAMSQQGTMSGQGSMNQGSMSQGSMDQQSMGQQGTMSQGSMSQGSMSQSSMSQSSMAGGMSVAPGNQAPERDARGIAVMSDPAMAPAGANQMASGGGGSVVPASNQAAVFTAQASTENYPACSRTVTDNCVQSYERGRRPR